MGKSIGIDLGTTNSVGAFTRDGTNPIVISTREKEQLTPSVVTRHHRDGSLLVGRTAVRFAKADPQNAIFSIKRLMGRRYNDEEVGKVKQYVGYRIVPASSGTGMAHVLIGEKEYSPIEASALILEKIKTDAEVVLSEEVTHAVITVPAYFDDNQREATRQAGELAGLKVKRIIDEPTAAAYAYGMDLDPTEGKTIIVYDLGGGTFDISIIFISEGIPTVENIEGDNWLGGDKFDSVIMDYVLSRLDHGLREEARQDPDFMWEIKQEAERAKKDLGQARSTDIVMFGKLKGKVDVEVTVQRSDFESWIRQDIENSIQLIEKAMSRPGFTPDDIDHVLLVGGSTGLPLVRKMLAQKFGSEKIRATVDAMNCVALGAAILASRTVKIFCTSNHENEPEAEKCVEPLCNKPLRGAEPRVKCNRCGELSEKLAVVCRGCGMPLIGAEGGITAKPYGIEVEGGEFKEIVPKSTHYPMTTPMSREFKTVAENQERIVIGVYQGFETIAKQNEFQAEIVIPADGPIPEDERAPKDTPVDVGFIIDENGTLTIAVQGKGALSWLKVGKVLRTFELSKDGPSTMPRTVECPKCKAQNGRGASVCQNCGEVLREAEPQPPEDQWRRDLNFQLMFIQTAIRDYDWAVDARDMQRLQHIASEAQRVIDANDEAAGRLLAPQLEPLLNEICGGYIDLIEASWIYRMEMGKLDQRQRLGAYVEEYKRRVMGHEDPGSPSLRELRFEKMRNLVKEIVEGLDESGKVECANCRKLRQPPTPSNPACPNCGFNPYILR